MRKIFGIIIGILFLFLFLKPQLAIASITLDNIDPPKPSTNTGEIKFTFKSDSNEFDTGQTWNLRMFLLDDSGKVRLEGNQKRCNPPGGIVDTECVTDQGTLVIRWQNYGKEGTWKYQLYKQFYLPEDLKASGNIIILPPVNTNGTGLPALAMDHHNFKTNSEQSVFILNPGKDEKYKLWFNGEVTEVAEVEVNDKSIFISKYDQKAKEVKIKMGDHGAKNLCMTSVKNTLLGWTGSVVTLNCDFRLKGIVVTNLEPSSPGDFIISNKTGFPTTAEDVTKSGPCGSGFCKTAIGDISTDPGGFVKKIFGTILSLAGGVAIILIIISGYRLMASGGNPEKVQHAREQLTSAIVGLLFIIFSLSILQIIGVDILHIPGLSK